MKEKILKILKELRDDIDYEKCDKLIDDGCFGSFEILQIITAVCPTISAVITLLIGFASLIRTIKAIKADSENTKDVTLKELAKYNKALSKLNAKMTSIELALSISFTSLLKTFVAITSTNVLNSS